MLLTIKGSRFVNKNSTPEVTIGENKCKVISSTDTEITCTAPENDVGDQVIRVTVPDVGVTEPNTVLKYRLTSESSDVVEGSLLGGTFIKVTGEGFGTDAKAVKVMTGDYECDVTEVKNTEVHCRTRPAANVVSIENSAVNEGKKTIRIKIFTVSPL